MIIKTLAGALALLIPAVPSIALAQVPEYPYSPPRYVVPESEPMTSPLTVVPPAYGSVYVYAGRSLVGRFDGPGALWLANGGVYRIVAMRGDQVVWSGDRRMGGTPVELRWPAPPQYTPSTQCPWAYPSGPLTSPIERGRVRTPLP
jgi:hypothetical protein